MAASQHMPLLRTGTGGRWSYPTRVGAAALMLLGAVVLAALVAFTIDERMSPTATDGKP